MAFVEPLKDSPRASGIKMLAVQDKLNRNLTRLTSLQSLPHNSSQESLNAGNSMSELDIEISANAANPNRLWDKKAFRMQDKPEHKWFLRMRSKQRRAPTNCSVDLTRQSVDDLLKSQDASQDSGQKDTTSVKRKVNFDAILRQDEDEPDTLATHLPKVKMPSFLPCSSRNSNKKHIKLPSMADVERKAADLAHFLEIQHEREKEQFKRSRFQLNKRNLKKQIDFNKACSYITNKSEVVEDGIDQLMYKMSADKLA